MSEINLDKLERMPENLLLDITNNPDKESAEINATPPLSPAPEAEIFESGNSANIDLNTGPSSAPGSGPKITINSSANTKPLSAGTLLSGTFATDLMDNLLPAIAVLVIVKVGYNIDRRALQLTPKEKDTIAPVMQQYLDSINVNFNNPLYNLLMVIGAIYGAKVIQILPDLKKKASKEKTFPAVVANKIQEIKEKTEKINTEKKERHLENSEILKLDFETAINYIKKSKRKSREDAINIYKKIKGR